MRHSASLSKILAMIIITALIPALSSCSSGTSGSSDAQNVGMTPVERVLHAIIDYPCENEDLYKPSMAYIGLGTEGPTEEQIAADEKALAEEKAAWEAEVGDCFAGEMFDTFFGHYERTAFLGEAYMLKLNTVVTGITRYDQDGTGGADAANEKTAAQGDGEVETLTVTIKATDETGHVDTYDTVWLVKYDKTDPQLLQSIELLVDGGFFCRTGCPL